MANTIFYIMAGIIVASAFLTVTAKNLYHCSLFLVLSLFGTAGVFVFLGSEFLASVQVLIYVGAVTVLLIFGIMLTRQVMDANAQVFNRQLAGAVLTALLVTGVCLKAIHGSLPFLAPPTEMAAGQSDVYLLGLQLLRPENGFVFAFELVSFLLLSALIGAIVLARKEAE